MGHNHTSFSAELSSNEKAENENEKQHSVYSRNDQIGGSKMALLGHMGLWHRLKTLGFDVALIWRNILLTIMKSLIVVNDNIDSQPNCFEVFGYDVILDHDYNAWYDWYSQSLFSVSLKLLHKY
jgi:hypothetical protein